jgi:hypothetical protein
MFCKLENKVQVTGPVMKNELMTINADPPEAVCVIPHVPYIASMYREEDGWTLDDIAGSGDRVLLDINMAGVRDQSHRDSLFELYQRLGSGVQELDMGVQELDTMMADDDRFHVDDAVLVPRWGNQKGNWKVKRKNQKVDAFITQVFEEEIEVSYDKSNKCLTLPMSLIFPLQQVMDEDLPEGIHIGGSIDAKGLHGGWHRAKLLSVWKGAQGLRHQVLFDESYSWIWRWDSQVRSILTSREAQLLSFILCNHDVRRDQTQSEPWRSLSTMSKLVEIRRAGEEIQYRGDMGVMGELDVRMLNFLVGTGSWYVVSRQSVKVIHPDWFLGDSLCHLSMDEFPSVIRQASVVLEYNGDNHYRMFRLDRGVGALESLPVDTQSLDPCVPDQVMLSQKYLSSTDSSDSESEYDDQDIQESDDNEYDIREALRVKKRRRRVEHRVMTQSVRGALILSRNPDRIPLLQARPLAIMAAPDPVVKHKGARNAEPEALEVFSSTIPGTPRHCAMHSLRSFFIKFALRKDTPNEIRVTGPCGSGKTSAIHACLSYVRRLKVKRNWKVMHIDCMRGHHDQDIYVLIHEFCYGAAGIGRGTARLALEKRFLGGGSPLPLLLVLEQCDRIDKKVMIQLRSFCEHGLLRLVLVDPSCISLYGSCFYFPAWNVADSIAALRPLIDEDIIGDSVLEFCIKRAVCVAQYDVDGRHTQMLEKGDMRVIVSLLDQAVDNAYKSGRGCGRSSVKHEHALLCPSIRTITIQCFQSLSPLHKLVLYSAYWENREGADWITFPVLLERLGNLCHPSSMTDTLSTKIRPRAQQTLSICRLLDGQGLLELRVPPKAHCLNVRQTEVRCRLEHGLLLRMFQMCPEKLTINDWLHSRSDRLCQQRACRLARAQRDSHFVNSDSDE